MDLAVAWRPSVRGGRDGAALCRCRTRLPVRPQQSSGRRTRTGGPRLMARILIDKLRHSYVQDPQKPEDYALKEMSLELADGGAYALLGPSGCGKTTLLNLISGLLHPTEGRILFDDT